jgi:hypothetical protein
MSAVLPWLKQRLVETYTDLGLSQDCALGYVYTICYALDSIDTPMIDTEYMQCFLYKTLMAGIITQKRRQPELIGIVDESVRSFIAQLRSRRHALTREQAEHFVIETLMRLNTQKKRHSRHRPKY